MNVEALITIMSASSDHQQPNKNANGGVPEGAETADPTQPGESDPLSVWVVEANLDIPVRLPARGNATPTAMYVSLSGEDPDGFVEMRPRDHARATSSVFWSAAEPVAYECRAVVRASISAYALLRGQELYEHVADRLTLLFGYPVRVLNVGFTYNEGDLKRCIDGQACEFSATSGGSDTYRTQLPKNSRPELLAPPASALEAIRWFRHGMTASRRIDQYLSYYIALESIARHVPGVTRQPRPDAKGGQPELESQESAAINYLLGRRNVPASGRRTLSRIRARIAHGNTDGETLALAAKNVPFIQRLAADGIALVCGLEPDAVNVLSPNPIEFLAVIGSAPYAADDNPASRWGGLLSDVFKKFVAQAKEINAYAPDSAGQS